jgi:hypothetical protein
LEIGCELYFNEEMACDEHAKATGHRGMESTKKSRKMKNEKKENYDRPFKYPGAGLVLLSDTACKIILVQDTKKRSGKWGFPKVCFCFAP